MGSEIRRVPPDWEHPRNERGDYIPMFDKEYHAASRAWIDGLLRWEQGERPKSAVEIDCRYYWEWYGAPPDLDEQTYRTRSWTTEEATAYQVYETVTEGTPASPVFTTLDAAISWLVENGYPEAGARSLAHPD